MNIVHILFDSCDDVHDMDNNNGDIQFPNWSSWYTMVLIATVARVQWLLDSTNIEIDKARIFIVHSSQDFRD